MSTLKEQLQADLTAAIRAQDSVVSGTLRMALAAITNEEVAGKAAKTLTDAETVTVLTREGKKRREAIEAYVAANRQDLADKEAAELAVLEQYLPEQLGADELAQMIADAVAEAKHLDDGLRVVPEECGGPEVRREVVPLALERRGRAAVEHQATLAECGAQFARVQRHVPSVWARCPLACTRARRSTAVRSLRWHRGKTNQCRCGRDCRCACTCCCPRGCGSAGTNRRRCSRHMARRNRSDSDGR